MQTEAEAKQQQEEGQEVTRRYKALKAAGHKVVFISINPDTPVRDRSGLFVEVDSVWAYDSPCDQPDTPLDIMEVAKVVSDEEEDEVDAQIKADCEALNSVLASAKELGYTHYVLDDGLGDVTEGVIE
jgi:hypothetical protein